MIGLAVIATIAAGVAGSFLEPAVFGGSLPVAVMGGFILKAVLNRNKGRDDHPQE